VRRLGWAALAAVAVAVAGCGGGSGNVKPKAQEGADVTPPAVATTATVPAPAPSDDPQGPLGARLRRTVALRDKPGGKVLGQITTKTRWGSPRILAVTDRKEGWLGVLSERVPGKVGWIPSESAELLLEPWTLQVDLSARRLTVRRDGRVVRRVRVAIGAPGTATPRGRFAVTDTLRLVGDGPYGCCAIALTARQRDIPQGWTGGDRVAIHGTNSPGSIGRAASHGCLRAGEGDLRWLLARIPLGTHVRIVS
jgi:lipoprotein-anchoring transpeptidase ErfK/SrfK